MILTDVERNFLKVVIKYVKRRVVYIKKWEHYITPKKKAEVVSIYYCIKGSYGKCFETMYLHRFPKGEQFQGMELDKEYTLEELGL